MPIPPPAVTVELETHYNALQYNTNSVLRDNVVAVLAPDFSGTYIQPHYDRWP